MSSVVPLFVTASGALAVAPPGAMTELLISHFILLDAPANQTNFDRSLLEIFHILGLHSHRNLKYCLGDIWTMARLSPGAVVECEHLIPQNKLK